jgi:adenylate kinase family enzyme
MYYQNRVIRINHQDDPNWFVSSYDWCRPTMVPSDGMQAQQFRMLDDSLSFRRIAIVGTCGAGKTSFANSLSTLLSVPHIELDELHWSANWVEVPDEVFRERVSKAVAAEGWITDGNYKAVRDLVWNRADTVIWLDYSFALVMSRLFLRTMDRIIKGTEIWHGNKETWRMQFLEKDSILWWGLSTFSRRRQEYKELWKSEEFEHINFVRFDSPRQAEAWLQQLNNRR